MKTPKPISKLRKLALFAAVLSLFAFVIPKADDTPIDKLIAALQKWTTDNPQEKVYLQMDKPYYVLGDTIWFKGYVTVGSRHQLSAVSGSVYVDLINEQDSIIRSLKLPAISGMVMGDFTLGDELKQGNYRIRAYTQWMRNAGEEYFFDRTITVGSVFSNGIVTKADYAYKDVDNKPVLTATLNYTDDKGQPLTDKDVLYRIMIDKKIVWTKNARTDAQGNIQVAISNENKVDLNGAYIRTTLTNNSNKEIIKDFPIKASLSQSDVQFFPESGSLLNGVISRVAFKAVGVDGLGINITGKIINNENKEIADIVTTHAGMGNFLLKPEAGKSYTAKINFADGSTKNIALPKANDEGYVLSIYQPGKDSILVRVYTNQKQLQTPTSVNLVAQSGGEMIAATTVKIEKPMTSVWMNKKDFPSGIAQFTLFNNDNQPLNERIAFIRSNDQLNLTIKTNKSGFKSKEPVFFTMDAKDGSGKPTIGNFSVSVIDESKVPADETMESTILSNLLLTSDIKGYVEKPNYYFIKESKEVNEALDNLMLTQGYRRYVWKDLNGNLAGKPRFPAEDLGFAIAGKVQNLSHKPVANASVTLLSIKAKVTKFATTDSLGRFKFDGMFLTDSVKFTVQARTKTNGSKLIVELDTLPKLRINKNPNMGDVTTDLGTALKAYVDAGKKQDDLNEKLGRMDQVHRLRQVNITAGKAKNDILTTSLGNNVAPAALDQSYIMQAKPSCATLGACLTGMLRGVTFKGLDLNGAYAMQYPFCLEYKILPPVYVPMQVFLDGRKLSYNDAADFMDSGSDLDGIAKVDVVRGSMIHDPALYIYTKPDYIRKENNASIVNITPKGFNRAREFYSPKYSNRANLQEPDMRSTIYWNPYLKTDSTGKSSFSFFNADGPGTYKVTVEGIDADGRLGRQVFRYQVEGELVSGLFTPPVAGKDEQVKLIAASLDSLNKRLPGEKVYLHLDKPYYNIGDTLWFKGYLMNPQNMMPSKMSGLLYVELDNDSSEVVRRVSLKVNAGMVTGQIPLVKAIFQEGGYTLRAYTNWMQNFGEDYIFNQRFYLGVPAGDAWLVRSNAGIKRAGDKDQLDVELKLNRADKGLSSLALRKVEVKIYEGKYYLYKEEMQTGIDGSLKFSKVLKDKLDGRMLHLQITSLDPADKDKKVQIPLRINRSQKMDVQFLPEGGALVAGLKSTVGFKAIGEDGKGTPVAGIITDSKSNTITEFITLHNGMGSFEFTPNQGEVYSAKINQPEGVEQSYTLPAVNNSGAVLHIGNKQDENTLHVSIAANLATTTDSAYYLIGTSGGKLYYSQKAELNKGELTVDKKLFPAGIARFTLFKGNRPLNQRVVFIDQKDQLKINVIANKQSYLKRDSVALDVMVTDQAGLPVKGNFSLAVTDDTQVKPDTLNNYSINTSLLVNSELKGIIESPGYYLNPKNKQAWAALDNLLLTQGWTGYDWKDVFAPATQPRFKLEKELVVTGKVTNLAAKPVPNAEVIISSQKPSFITKTITDINGVYKFDHLPVIDSGSFFIQGNNKNGKARAFGNVSVEKLIPPKIPEMVTNPAMPWYVNADTTQLNLIKRIAQRQNDANVKAAGTLLKNVVIKKAKIIKGSENRNGPGNADIVFDEKEIKESGVMNLYQLLKQKLPGLTVVDESGLPTIRLGRKMVVIMIDGGSLQIMLDASPKVQDLIDELSAYQIQTFKGMEVMTSEKYLREIYTVAFPYRFRVIPFHYYAQEINASRDSLRGAVDPSGDRPIDGPFFRNSRPHAGRPGYLEKRANVVANAQPEFAVIEITTGNGTGWYRNMAPGAVTYRPLPLMYPQQFYSPKYKLNAPAVGEPDYRATVYWEPNITTDINGKAKVSFYTSDLPKDYTINVQGVSTDGGIGSLVTKLSGAKTVTDKGPVTGAIALPVKVKDDQSKSIAAALDTIRKRLPLEKVYLHTDKPYYHIGDTLWFKSYLTDARNRASKQSGVLHVELVDDSTEVVRRVTVPIKNGTGQGQISLSPRAFHDGAYTLRAYTNWMQNFGEDIVFTQRFYMGASPKNAWLVASKTTVNPVEDKDKLDVDITLSNADKSAVTLQDVKVMLYRGNRVLLEERMRTGVDGNLKFSKLLKEGIAKADLRLQIQSTDKQSASKLVQVPIFNGANKRIDLQFLPEGGNLVAGIKSVVGFKAIGQDGRGVYVSGMVNDSHGKKVASFSELYNGMGSFELTPVAGEVYTAKIIQLGAAIKPYDLPRINSTGAVMHIDNPELSDSLKVSISGLNKITADSSYYLMGSSGDKVFYSQQVDAKRNVFTVDKTIFPSGITSFTLLKRMMPLNKRMVFIDHNDQLQFKVNTNKASYQKRDSAVVEVEVTDRLGMPVSGNFSLSVTDNSQVKADTLGNYSIAANLLLNSELKGLVETPGYYLNRKDKQAWQALDNLMLTQGWSIFSQRGSLAYRPTTPRYRAEQQNQVAVFVADLKGKPMINAPVLLWSKKPDFILKGNTKPDGRYVFNGLPDNDTVSYFIQARTPKGRELYSTLGYLRVGDFMPAKPASTLADVLAPWYVNSDAIDIRHAALVSRKVNSDVKAEGTLLKNVKIKSSKIIKGSENPYGDGKSDLAFDESDIRESAATNVWQLLRQKLPGIKDTVVWMLYQKIPIKYRPFRVLKFGQYYVLDKDIEMDGHGFSNSSDYLKNLSTQGITGLEVAYSKKYTNTVLNGATEPEVRYDIAKIILTSSSKIELLSYTRADGTTMFRPIPLMYAEQFYSPRYPANQPVNTEPDLRSTIFWEPNLYTDANGKAKVRFYTSDLPKDYSINIQGLSPDGYMGGAIIKLTNTTKLIAKSGSD